MYSGPFSRFTLKRFAARDALPWHEHPHACVCVLLDGSMFEATRAASDDHTAGSLIYKPPALRHRNTFSTDTHVLSIELHGLRPGMPDRPVALRSQRVRTLAVRIASELSSGVADVASALRVDGLGLELIAEVPSSVARPSRRAPAWLDATHERLTAEFRKPGTIAAYAAAAGVHPTYLTRQFKAHFGESIGQCVRRLRLDFASLELSRTKLSLSQIALAAGFADQSHFSHVFQRERGLSPGEFRRRQSPGR
ncbi:MAG TPA: helix-turn-helix transcriptional regulator [Gemmatimonadaceae bacterium]|nr:helix-turn-helix transcriptional regulator [Gemmatimonadaceae bacterium]